MLKKNTRRISRFFLVALATGSLGLIPACAHRKDQQKSKESAERYYEIAVASFHNGMVEDARAQLRRSLHIDPELASAHYLRGLIDLREGVKMVDALSTEMCLRDRAARQSRARADELHRKARESFELALQYFPDNDSGRGRAYNSLAVVSAYFRNYKRAAKEAAQAVASESYNERYSALGNLGWAHLQRGDYVQAMTELRQALLINPDFCVARYRLAQAYLQAGRAQESLEEISAVIEDPRCPIQDAHRVLGQAQLRLGEAEAARTAFQACVAAAPRSCLAEDCAKLLALEPELAADQE